MAETILDPANEACAYDQITYPSHPYEASHPDHLYSIAKIFGVEARLPEQARVLELGCASGGNLIPVACRFPDSDCVGVDLSAKQVAEGQATIAGLGVKNIRLTAIDFCAIDESYGKFDYIICHGVFSWVPKFVQQRILEICHEHLNPKGIAYISYNANPGWYMRGMIRQMMLHHIKNIKEPKDKIAQARGLLNFLVESTEGQSTPYAMFLKQESELLSKHTDSYLFHEHLEENNHPMFYYQFIEMLTEQELQFLSESSLASMVTSNLPTKAAETLTRLTNDLHHRNQYTDFVTNRMFRQSLLCHRNVKIERHISEKSLQGMEVAGLFRTDSSVTPDMITSDADVSFTCNNGRVIKTTHIGLKMLMQLMTDVWPQSQTVEQLARKLEARASGETQSLEQFVSSQVLQLLVRGDIDFRYLPDRFTSEVRERPEAFSLSRHQAQSMTTLTTLRHNMLNLNQFSAMLVRMLDGTRTKEQLVDWLADMVAQGKLNVDFKGEQPADKRVLYGVAINEAMEQLRRNAVLVG